MSEEAKGGKVRRCDHPNGGVPCITPAGWRPVIMLVPSKTYMGKPFPIAMVKIAACEKHCTRMPDWFLTEEVWLEVLRAWYEQFPERTNFPPHRLSTRVSWQESAFVTPGDAASLPLG